MARNAGLSALLAIAYLAIAGAAQAYDDKALRPYAEPPASLKDEGGYGGGYEDGYPPQVRAPGVQIFVGTPHAYNGYRPYNGPYMYGSPSRSATGTYVGPGHGLGDPACRRWAWVHLEPGKWLWGIIDKPNGEWRCAEW